MRLAVIADEVTASGWRLIGASIRIPEPGAVEQSLRSALDDADVVLITAEHASQVSPAQLDTALRAHQPLVLVIADIRNTHVPAAIEQEVERAFGVNR